MVLQLLLLEHVTSNSMQSNCSMYISSIVGDDSNDALSPSNPVKSLDRVKEVWRKHTHCAFRNVYLEGNFWLNKSLNLWKSDSNMMFQQWSRNKKRSSGSTIISGGVAVPQSAWKPHPTDPGVWQASVSSSIPLNASSIFVDNSRRYRIRTPIMYWDKPISWSDTERSCWGFVYSKGNINPSWDLSPNALAHWRVVAFHQWSKSYHTVRAVYPQNNTIIFKQPAPFYYGQFVNNTASGKRWYIENIPELAIVAKSGQWRLTESFLTYAPQENESDPMNSTIVIPVLQHLFNVQNSQNVNFIGLSFAHTDVQCPVTSASGSLATTCDDQNERYDGKLFFAQNVINLKLENCSFLGSGGASIHINACPKANISRCLVGNAGGYGIRVTDSNNALVVNSKVDGAGQIIQNSGGISIQNCLRALITHNLVTNMAHVRGISYLNWHDRGAETEVSYNHIHHCGCESDECLSDGGGLYGASTTPSRTPVYLHHNVIHDIAARNFGGCGIYLDTSTNAAQVHHNIVWSVADFVFYWHLQTSGKVPLVVDAPATRVEHNVFVKNRQNLIPHTGTPPWHAHPLINHWDGYTNATFQHNIVHVDLPSSTHWPTFLNGAACSKHFHVPANASCTNISLDTFNHSMWDSNVYYNCSDAGMQLMSNSSSHFAGGSLLRWRQHGHDKITIIADPRFRNASVNDYRLQKDSPAIQLGFDAWDWVSPGAVGPNW